MAVADADVQRRDVCEREEDEPTRDRRVKALAARRAVNQRASIRRGS